MGFFEIFFFLFCLGVYLILSEEIESMQHSFHNHRYRSSNLVVTM